MHPIHEAKTKLSVQFQQETHDPQNTLLHCSKKAPYSTTINNSNSWHGHQTKADYHTKKTSIWMESDIDKFFSFQTPGSSQTRSPLQGC